MAWGQVELLTVILRRCFGCFFDDWFEQNQSLRRRVLPDRAYLLQICLRGVVILELVEVINCR